MKATAKIDGKDVVRYGSVADILKAGFSGLTNPPAEFTSAVAVSVSPEPVFTLAVTFDKAELPVGGTLKGKVTAKRAKDFAEEIALTQLAAPANVTAKLKPIAKGATEAEVELTAAGNAAVGLGSVILRGTAKVGVRTWP